MTLRNTASTLLWAATLWVATAAQAEVSTPSFSAYERQQIIQLGPWPPPVRIDMSNRVSGNARAIALGKLLFNDPRLSPVGYIACVTCHQPDRAFTDLKARAHGLADLPRNTPTLLNVAQQRWFGWDGGSDSLWLASIRPLLDAREFDSNPATVVNLFKRDPELAACYRSVFAESPFAQPTHTLVNVGKALAAYQETLVTAPTPFDDLRDALVKSGDALVKSGDALAQRYPAAAVRGLKLFVGRAGCSVCHSGPNFSDGQFHNGVLRANQPDAGRLEGVRSLRANPLNLLSRHNDDRSSNAARQTAQLAATESLLGRFRTPSLRNVTRTGPYMHDGQIDDIGEAIVHAWPASASAPTTAERNDLLAFIATLAETDGAHHARRAMATASCP
jgi:cytochrome c peroxidase